MRNRRVHRQNFGLGALRSGRAAYAGALIACCALLLQSIIPLVHNQHGFGDFPRWASTLCLAETPSPADRPTVPDKSSPIKAAPLCAVCLGLHLAGTYVPPTPIALPLSHESGGAQFPRRADVGVNIADWITARPRAPPLA